MTFRDQLLAKRANYLHSVAECYLHVLQAAQAVRDAKQRLRAMQHAQAATQSGLKVIDETLAALADFDKPKAPVKPAASAP